MSPSLLGLGLSSPKIPDEGRTVALVDLGTNSIRLLLVRVSPDLSYSVLSHRKETVRLGEGEYPSMELQPAAMERALIVCKRFTEMAQAQGAEEIIAVATSATRDAKNRTAFLNRLRKEANLDVRVVAGKEEARLIYLGVASGLHMPDDQALFLDVGGGSTEIIVGSQYEYQSLDTLQLGHIRLSMLFFPGEEGPISKKSYNEVQDHIRNLAVRALQNASAHSIDFAVGSSGTVENLAEIAARHHHGRKREPDEELHLADLKRVRRLLCGLPLAARAEVPGIDDNRAGFIVAGAAIVETIMEELGLESLQVSSRSLRDGLLLDYLSRCGLEHPDAGASFRETSVLRLGRRMRFNEDHAHRVADLSLQLFDSGQACDLHGDGDWERGLLYFASLLHDIGIALSYSSHNAHSYYFIRHADLLGFDQAEIEIMAAVAFFHRKGRPGKQHKQYRQLDKRARGRVRRLSALLSLAESLDRSHLGLVERAWFSTAKKKRALLHLQAKEHCPLELWAIDYQKKAFHKAFKRRLSVEMEGVEHPAPMAEAPD